jgi:hypothetical protein
MAFCPVTGKNSIFIRARLTEALHCLHSADVEEG